MKDTIMLLKKKIKVERNKRTKVDMLYELAYEHLSINSRKAYSYAKKAYYTSKSIDYEDGIKNNIAFYLAFNEFGVIDKEKLVKYVDAEKYYREQKDKRMLAFLLNSKGILYTLNMYYAKALVFFTEAFKLYSEIGNNSKALAIYSNIGAAYGRSGKKQEALNHYKRAGQILKLDLENAGYARMVFFLGYATELYNNDMDDEGERIVKVLYSEAHGRKDMYSVRAFVECHSKITDILIEKGEYELALIEMQSGLEYASEFRDICSTHGLYKSAANYYRELNEYDKAIKYLVIAKEIMLKRKNSLNFNDILLNVAEVYEESGQYERAFEAFDIYHKTKATFEKRSGEILMQTMLVDSEFELNKKINETLEKLIYQDQLTGLYNRKKLTEFEESLAEENEKYGILIIDVDDFKSINDRYGHQVGDEILIMVAGILDELCKGANLFRYAGDEFVIVSMNATEEEFQELLFEIREELSKVELLKKRNSINVSGGIAISHNNERFEEIFRKADCLMYENKITQKSKKPQK